MTLSQRTILIIVSTFIALLFILAATSDLILLKSFASLERTVLATNVKKVSNEIGESYDELNASASDVSEDILKHGSSHVSKLDGSLFLNHRIDIIACFSSTGDLLNASEVDFHKRTAVQQLQENEVTQLTAALSQSIKASAGNVNGLLMIGTKPLQTVVKRLESANVYVLLGRYIDAEEIKRIITLTGFALELFPINYGSSDDDISAALADFDGGVASPAHLLDQKRIAGYFLLKDIFGKPAAIGKITEQRMLYEHGKAAIAYVISALFVAGGVFCCVMLFFIRGTILSRLASLSNKVGKITEQRDISARLPLSDHHDELHNLAESINFMLESLESAEKELREGDERYRMLFERAPDAIIIIGMEDEEAGRIVAANQAAAEQHGYTVDELCTLRINDLNTSETNKISGDIFERVTRGEWVIAEIWHRKKDGTHFPIEVHAGLIKIKGKSYTLGFDRDITARKVNEESDRMYLDQIKQLNSELGQKAFDLAAANNELESFNYSVSHDMRGPLTRISGYCQVLLEDGVVTDPQIRTYISRIYESGNWLNDMIDAMLHLAQLARVEFVPDNVNMSEIARQTARELALAEPGRQVTFSIEDTIVASGDSRLLKIVMTNLLNNAWKYSSHTAETVIEFGINREDAQPVYFIRDNGVGFDMKDTGKLFRVFTRLHDQSQFNGTGIGLATVQRIVARHGGRIWAEGEIGKGATFFFTLKPDAQPEKQISQGKTFC